MAVAAEAASNRSDVVLCLPGYILYINLLASTQRNSFVSTAYLSLSSAFQLGLCDPLELHDTIQCMQFSYRLLGHSEKNVKFYFS